MSNADVVKKLNTVLADAIVFYQKLHHYHWRVGGEQFFKLHERFEDYYDQWKGIVDDVAERILTVGGAPLATLKDALELKTLSEEQSVPDPKAMVQNVLSDMQQQIAGMREVIGLAENTGDRGTVNLLDGFCDDIEKTCWMLKAFLEK